MRPVRYVLADALHTQQATVRNSGELDLHHVLNLQELAHPAGADGR